ncbi:Oidioi.mRNA.OKI2018_I69.PAR.g11275.t1.cds [Oikopleura dioica]|uniref:Oidioi.mRNA.OKI2018_I69.PAR.g11275.t1.cds n=1 Tax=Oikopleura dioica TaxID=34765 RepID=A0ABN7RYF0_OIKDI|nr:Oidioi.mRNA.OKI2018_I69.PAR.g11275.t1.cds [Oikopleura dioica]
MFENIATNGLLADLETIANLLTRETSPGNNYYPPHPSSPGYHSAHSSPAAYSSPAFSPYPPAEMTPVPRFKILVCSTPITITKSPCFSSPEFVSNSIGSSPASIPSPPFPTQSFQVSDKRKSNAGKAKKKKKAPVKKSKYCPCAECITARFELRIRPKHSRHPCIIPGCESSYAQPGGLKAHLLNHERNDYGFMKCYICNSTAFSFRDRLIEHILDHEEMSTGFVNPALPLPVLDASFLDSSSPFDYALVSYNL